MAKTAKATKTQLATAAPTDALPIDPMVSMIERIVSDPNADIDKLERMLQMKREHDTEQQRKEFNVAFAACQSEIPLVLKNRNNSQTRSTYADLAAIEKAVSPVIAKHGISVRFFPTRSDINGHMGVDCVVSHSAGHSETYHADIPVDGAGMKGNANKTATHAFGSTMSYGRRYLLCMIFNIATTDDNDGQQVNASPKASEKDIEQIKEMAKKAGMPLETICKSIAVSALEDIDAVNVSSLIRKLQATIDKKEKEVA